MSIDVLTLLQRDHHDLVGGLAELLVPMSSIAQLRSTLDGVRLGLIAHAEAEDIVLSIAITRCEATDELEALVAEGRTAHRAQEAALGSLVCAPPATRTWFDRARALSQLVVDHAAHEEHHLLPAIRDLAPAAVYASLAGAFATERMRQLAMLQPSAPIYMPQLVQAQAC